MFAERRTDNRSIGPPLGHGSHGLKAMSDQTATSGITAAPRALELPSPHEAARRARADRRRLLARLSIDVGSIACAALIVQASAATPLHGLTLVLAAAAIVAGYAAGGLYDQTPPRLGQELLQVLSVPALVMMALAGAELALGSQQVGDAAVRFWLLAATMTGGGRLTVNGAQALLRRGAAPSRGNTLIVGAGRVGHLAAKRLLEEPALGLRPVGFLDKDPLRFEPVPGVEPVPTLPVLGASYDLEDIVLEHGVEHVLVAFSTAPSHVVLDLVRRCWALGVSVRLVPRLYEVEGRRTRTEHLGALPLVALDPADPRGWRFTVKYALDRVFAALALLIVAPLLAAVAVGILITSGRPVLFRQRRVGRDGHVFGMLKFRTMDGAPEADGELDAEWAAEAVGGPPGDIVPVAGDDRRTRLGSLLRKLSIDELPQLWNVLRGDMSIIGPRPERVHYVELFEQAVYRYPDRHRVKSGLTGWSQVNGLRGETSLADRIEWDNFYIENWSPWLDLKILVKTIPALVAGRGAR
jgi:exopolysaccharide biosynthesis polyprenyl glycosylphosphotransferase